RLASSSCGLGMLPGTLRRPSMSSEKAMRRVLTSLICSKAWRTQVVRAPSPKVPMCGRPEGPYPVSKMTVSFGLPAAAKRSSRLSTLRASSNGHACAFSASSRREDGALASVTDMWSQYRQLICRASDLGSAPAKRGRGPREAWWRGHPSGRDVDFLALCGEKLCGALVERDESVAAEPAPLAGK